MIEVCLLGTGGMMPLPYRALTSLMLRYKGSNILIDCGEGTQTSIRQQGWSFNSIDVICITHFHADHISGLPGLLLTIGNAERTDKLTIIGPKKIEKIVNSLRVIAPELPYEIEFKEIEGATQDIVFGDIIIRAFKVNHNILCYGYTITLNRLGKFNKEKAEELKIPVSFWRQLQNGETVQYKDKIYTSQMVMGIARKGIKLTYCTDTRPTESIISNAKDSDLFICEGMYGEGDKEQKAKENKHMTMNEAAHIAKSAGVKEMWLTHFSPATNRPADFLPQVKEIFENTVISKDRQFIELKFIED